MVGEAILLRSMGRRFSELSVSPTSRLNWPAHVIRMCGSSRRTLLSSCALPAELRHEVSALAGMPQVTS
jgi:hypothetical protein